MCGIFGLFLAKNTDYPYALLKPAVDSLLKLSESRGKEASGIATFYKNRLNLQKESACASVLVRSRKYKNLMQELIVSQRSCKARESLAIIGHTRLATNGPVEKENNCPLVTNDVVGVHNGIIVNAATIYKYFNSLQRKGSVDSEAIFGLIDLFSRKMPLLKAVQNTYGYLEGSASIALMIPNSRQLVLATNTGSLYFCRNQKNNVIIFASELSILQNLIKKLKLSKLLNTCYISQLKPMQGQLINLDTLGTEQFNLSNQKHIDINFDQANKSVGVQVLNSSIYPAQEAMQRIKRCTRCILPSTMPFIKFDQQGVCNYCHDYKKIKVEGEDALENLIAVHRSKNGAPDCVVAFSGGRDSAYGLHYVKKVLKMNPIAFTYDWGMVADIGRRNQSRMVSKLGVEHIINAADIGQRRKYIKQNIGAWLKRPHLGMVPLFMAGDKPVEYYVTKIAKKYGIKLVFLFRGNELETTEYKFGFLGVKNSEPRGVMHEMPIASRIKLAMSALQQYVLNPAYFNSSLVDILFAYYVTCMMPLNFVYLWHYIKWDESQIIKTLRDEYGWETETDTTLTWRTDDGTAPFYNYIYCTVAGFTENDAFRSNQIREGLLLREEALKIVKEENRPRYDAIKDYLGKVGLDYNQVMQKIEAIPKLYK